jgi:hypothetical protein
MKCVKANLSRARLDQIINMKHELVQLAGKIHWDLDSRPDRVGSKTETAGKSSS